MITGRFRYFTQLQTVRLSIMLTIIVIWLIPSPLNAQEDLPSRPKLGLALSGGGAKGLAHIGVIKVMEESGLRPDYITGVSMGSIIGGMYAMGYSADSIATIFRLYDWNLTLTDRIAENKIIFLEKKHYYNSLISLPITRKAIKIPSGLINGQHIESGLNYYFWPAARIRDFSELPIPFLCLATDVVTSRKVIFRNGYLPDAIRASIAIPSIFTPVRTDTAVLVDGGVVRNYAATELREMGADIVLGSYTSFLGSSENDLESAYGILKQIGFLTSLADFEEERRETDILVIPEIGDVSVLAFNNTDSIIDRSYRYSLRYKERFRALADSLDALGPQKQMTPLATIDNYKFDRIDVIGNQTIKDDQIIGVLDIRPGDAVNRDMLAERIELLYGKVWFEKVKYRIIPRNDSLILEIDCIERPKAMIYGSLHYDPALSSGVVLSLSARDLITNKSVINVDSYIGQFYRFRISAIQFIDRSQKFGMEASFFSDNTRFPLVRLRDETGPMVNQNFITGLTLSKRLSLNHLMSLSVTYEDQHLIPDYLTSTHINRLTFDYLKFAVNYLANTLDRKHFPKRGICYCLSATSSKLLKGVVKTDTLRYVYSKEDVSPFSFDRFYTARAWFMNYASLSDKVTLSFGGDILFSPNVDSITSNNNQFFLGGIEPVTDRSVTAIGFHSNQIAVRNMAAFRMGADIEIATGLYLTFGGNIFLIQEPDRIDGATIMGGYGIGAGYMTVAGPIRIGLMHGIYDRELFYKQVKGYVSIGFTF
ncbi:MAG: patatin-like phospholipase family protein [Bacteroidales bacterium]|jgi:NTE family protein|nr:patatin-like phospholipase family protein [Bacteroidales bacterium]